MGKKVRETVLFYYLYCSSFDSFIFYCGVKICLIFMSTMYGKLIFCIRYNIFTLKLLELGNDDKYFFYFNSAKSYQHAITIISTSIKIGIGICFSSSTGSCITISIVYSEK